MQHLSLPLSVRVFLALLILISSASCGSTTTPIAATSTTAPTIAIPATEISATDAPATEAPLPTATPAPSQTPEPTATVDVPPTATTAASTATADVLPSITEGDAGLSAWCLPEHVSVAALQTPLEPPATARIGEIVEGALEINNLPVSACEFIYTFDQPAPAGLTLQVYEVRGKRPWLTAELKPVDGKPEAVYADLRHVYIVAPPLWDVSYQFAVVDDSGQELRRDAVNLHRWKPELCWNGRLPNPVTLRCPLPQDLHPWDPSYGTPIPTFPPEDD